MSSCEISGDASSGALPQLPKDILLKIAQLSHLAEVAWMNSEAAAWGRMDCWACPLIGKYGLTEAPKCLWFPRLKAERVHAGYAWKAFDDLRLL